MSDNDIEPSDVSAQEADGETVEQTTQRQAKRGNGVAWLAVLLSGAAVAVVGFQAIKDWRTVDSAVQPDPTSAIEELRTQLTESGEALSAVDAKIAQIQPQDYSGDIEKLRNDVGRQLQLLGSLPTRMATLENSVASLAGISAGARETFLLAEAEYYLQIANAQLQLANNAELAALALKMADERVTQMSDPALIDVRRAISNEMAALDVMEKPDLVGTSLSLASLARVLESLPLAKSLSSADEAVTENDEEQSTAARAWQSVTNALGTLVKVTPPDQAKLRLISPNAEFFLRNNIAMQLQAARLALLRGEHALFQQALADSDTLLETYFDPASEQVDSARTTIGEIRNLVFTASSPDISGSLRLLRQFKTLRETNK